MRIKLGIILILLGLIMPLNVNAANTDLIKYIIDEHTNYFDVEYNEDYNLIIARTDIDNNLSDKKGIEGFNEGIANIIFSDEIEELDRTTDIMFIAYAEDADGVEQSQAVVYYTYNDIGFLRAIGLLEDKESYRFATTYSITKQFSQYLEDFEEAEALKGDGSIEKVVNSMLGMSKDAPLPDFR